LNKIVIPVILTVTILIAGIFAFMPVEKVSTVHGTLQTATSASTAHGLLQTLTASTAQTATIQNSQLNNTKTTFQLDLGVGGAGSAGNATANCGTAGGGFLVYWTFTNLTSQTTTAGGVNTALGIQNSTGTGTDITVTLSLGNTTAVSGVIGGLTGETIVFTGSPDFEDTGDLVITVVCQAGSTAGTTP